MNEEVLSPIEIEPSEENDLENRVYELSFILVPLLSPEDTVVKFGDLKDFLSGLGANFITEELPRLLELAYQMDKTIDNKKHKFNNGYFAWLKFDLNQESLVKLKEKIQRHPDIIRFLLIKTVRENTLAPRRSINRELVRKKEKEEVLLPPIDKEAVDKKIEELVV